MSTIIIENPRLNLQSLSVLEKKIESNEADESDYMILESFLSSVGVEANYLLEKLKEQGIHSYQEYILERKKPFDKKNKSVDGILLGYFIGSISVLKEFSKINRLG